MVTTLGTGARVTAMEFAALCDAGGPCELVRGEVVPLSPGGFEHSRIVVRVTSLLDRWAHERGQGRVLAGEAGIIVAKDPDTIRGADVAYISYERLPREAESSGFCSAPPELVVEVVGQGRGWGEMVEKAGEYLAMGVDRVWIIDPTSRRLHVFRPDGEPVALRKSDEIIGESALAGFRCVVDEFLMD